MTTKNDFEIMPYNSILIKIVIFKPFLNKKSKKMSTSKQSINIRILNENFKKYINIEISKLIEILEPLGFNSEFICFDNIKLTDIVNLKIDNVNKNDYIEFLSDILPNIIYQKHYLTISYGYKKKSEDFYYDTDDVLSRSIRSGLIKHNTLNKKCYYKFILKSENPESELPIYNFFNVEYLLVSSEQGTLYIDEINNKMITLTYKINENGVDILNYITTDSYYLILLRKLKINNFLD
jgi:hypothetical protein